MLQNNYQKGLGIVVSSGNYADLWTRDAYFASLGSLALKDFAAVKDTITTLAKFQRQDGLIPLRLGRGNIICKFCFGSWYSTNNKQLKATYVDDKAGYEPSDSCSQFILLIKVYDSYAKTLHL